MEIYSIIPHELKKNKHCIIHLGLTYALTAIGVAAGFFVGGQFSQNFFVDYDRVDQDR